MKNNSYYETVSEAINDLTKRGYTTDFEILNEKECLVCHKTSSQLSPDEFEIDETYRFEGNTDPGDEMIVFAISSVKHNIKGIVVNAYGMYADSSASKIIERLHNHLKRDVLIKRGDFLKQIIRERHQGFLLCWKIRTGIRKNVEAARIKKYTDWFYKTYLIHYFKFEEKYIFPILPSENKMRIKAMAEHRRLKRLFESDTDILKNSSLIEEELENHIRFEERMLFDEVKRNVTEEQLQQMRIHHLGRKFADNLSDTFWKENENN